MMRRAVASQPAHAENEQIRRVRKQRESHEDLKVRGRSSSHTPEPARTPIAKSVDDFHQPPSPPGMEIAAQPRRPWHAAGAAASGHEQSCAGPRSDWCASATRISTVAPTTSR